MKKKKKEDPEIIKESELQCTENFYCVNIEPDQIYDGDTIMNVDLHIFHRMIITIDVRLARINTPEIRTKDKDEKEKGYEARDYLRSLLYGRKAKLKLLGKGKYGRYICELYCPSGNVSDKLLEEKLAKPYKG